MPSRWSRRWTPPRGANDPKIAAGVHRPPVHTARMASAAQEGVDYLLDYTESIASLPAELQKTLALIGELDSKLTSACDASTVLCPSLVPSSASALTAPCLLLVLAA